MTSVLQSKLVIAKGGFAGRYSRETDVVQVIAWEFFAHGRPEAQGAKFAQITFETKWEKNGKGQVEFVSERVASVEFY